MREDHHDLRSGDLPRQYTPPKAAAPRPMRYVLKVQHGSFLLPPGVGVQEAAALAYMLGQSRRIESRYRDGKTGWTPLDGERPEIALAIIDPADVDEPVEDGATA